MSTTSNNYDQVRKINRDEVRLLWYVDFWDGPINGLCLYHNKKYWFEMIDHEQDLPDTTQRRFLVLELSRPQLTEEERWHDFFRQKVGTHCDFEEPNPEVKPKETHREFYEAYGKRAKPNYSNNAVIGWFELN